MFGSEIVFVTHIEFRLLDLRMALEVCAHQFPVPGPVVFAVRGGMYAKESAPGLNIAFEIGLLHMVKHIPCGIEEDHGGVAFQRILPEVCGVLGGIHHIPVRGAEFHQGQFAHTDGTVPESLGGGEHQHPGLIDLFGETGMQPEARNREQNNSDKKITLHVYD